MEVVAAVAGAGTLANAGTVANSGTVASAGTAVVAVAHAGTGANAGTVASAACNVWACSDCNLNDELRAAEEYTSDDEDIQAAQAYLASEDTMFAHDVAVGEEVAEDLALEQQLSFPNHEYDDYDNYECTCEGTFGLNDDGEINYHECR
jgi:hypothetical protein